MQLSIQHIMQYMMQQSRQLTDFGLLERLDGLDLDDRSCDWTRHAMVFIIVRFSILVNMGGCCNQLLRRSA
jgi:hypothetical protein